jgi:hypothetical protein
LVAGHALWVRQEREEIKHNWTSRDRPTAGAVGNGLQFARILQGSCT